MDFMTSGADDAQPAPQIDFRGDAGDFFVLQLGNLLLTIITLGIWRFWGKTRYRRRLWGGTNLGGDPIEYRGTGIELFIGALLAILLISVPLGIASIVMPLLFGKGSSSLFLAQIPLYLLIWYMIGVGIYRSFRYLLARTAWRGIRGGMIEGGWSFGLYNFGLVLAQIFSLGFATPWVGTRRWNRLTNDMWFGSFQLTADASARRLYPRFLLVWGAIFLTTLIFAGMIGWGFYASFKGATADIKPSPGAVLAIVGGIYGGLFVIGFVGALLFAHYRAAFLRETYGSTTIGGDMRLRFEVTTGQVVRYYLGNMALVIFTMGLGMLMLPYRRWAFHTRRIRIDGTFDEARLEQTDLVGPSQGEGIADAFDLSPF